MAKFKGKGGSAKTEKNLGKKTSSNFKSKKVNPANTKKVFKKNKGKGVFNSAKKKQEKAGKTKELGENVAKAPVNVVETGKRKLQSNVEGSEGKKVKTGTERNRLMAIYEQLRRKNTSKEDKHKLIEEVLQQHVKDKENQVAFKHDTVRVLEHCMKFGNDQQRECLFELFKENTVGLVTAAGYSKFLVKKFIEYGTREQKAKIISSFNGKVRKLIKHKTASDILEEIYAKHANAVQRAALTEEFYGPDFNVFKIATGLTFEDMIAKEPEKKETVMEFMKTQFVALSQKDTILHSITHKALLQFFKYASDSQKQEVYDVLKERVIQILHTKDGAKVALNCLWLATTKERKNIMKSFKTFVVKVCQEEYGHLVMLALFDVVDDTILIKKVIFPEILANLQELIANQYGRKVILYLLKPRCHSYFLPDIIKMLEHGDNNPYSKKIAAVRQEELRISVLSDLLSTMTPHVKDILKNKSVAIVLLAAIDCSDDSPELIVLFEEIAKVISKPLKDVESEGASIEETDTSESSNENDHPICNACGHWVIKSIIQKDKARISDDKKVIFSQYLCNAMATGSFADWADFNRGAFVLVSLLETKIDSVVSRIREDLSLLPKTSLSLENEPSSKGIGLLQKLIFATSGEVS